MASTQTPPVSDASPTPAEDIHRTGSSEESIFSKNGCRKNEQKNANQDRGNFMMRVNDILRKLKQKGTKCSAPVLIFAILWR